MVVSSRVGIAVFALSLALVCFVVPVCFVHGATLVSLAQTFGAAGAFALLACVLPLLIGYAVASGIDAERESRRMVNGAADWLASAGSWLADNTRSRMYATAAPADWNVSHRLARFIAHDVLTMMTREAPAPFVMPATVPHAEPLTTDAPATTTDETPTMIAVPLEGTSAPALLDSATVEALRELGMIVEPVSAIAPRPLPTLPHGACWTKRVGKRGRFTFATPADLTDATVDLYFGMPDGSNVPAIA
jgi:hypothetical protein